MTEYSLERLGQYWRLRHSECFFTISWILKALTLPEFEAEMRNAGFQTGIKLAKEVYEHPHAIMTLIPSSRGSSGLEKTIGEMMEKAYAERLPNIRSLALDLGLVRHCSIFETFLKELVFVLSSLKPEQMREFSAALGKKRKHVPAIVNAFGMKAGIDAKLKVIEDVVKIRLDEAFKLRDINTDVGEELGREYLVELYNRRNGFLHSMIPDVESSEELEIITHFFEQIVSSINRAVASANDTEAAK